VDRAAPNATIVERDDLTEDIARFVVLPDDGVPPFRPGQYLALGLPIDDRLVQRPYSPASRPASAATLEFLIRRVPGGRPTPRLWIAPGGSRVRLGRPKGLFTLLPDDPRTHLFVATGTGLAPFVSMLDELLDRPDPPRVVVVHGVARAAELAYRERLERLVRRPGARVVYAPTVSRDEDPANAGWAGRIGRAEAALDPLFGELGLDPRTAVAYLCGNPGMIVAAGRMLLGRGLPADAIRTEQYWPADDPAPANELAA